MVKGRLILNLGLHKNIVDDRNFCSLMILIFKDANSEFGKSPSLI